MGEEAAPMASAWRRLLRSGWADPRTRWTRLDQPRSSCRPMPRQLCDSLAKADSLVPWFGSSCVLRPCAVLFLPNQFDDNVEEDRHECVGDDEDQAEIHGVLLSSQSAYSLSRSCFCSDNFAKRRPIGSQSDGQESCLLNDSPGAMIRGLTAIVTSYPTG